MSRRISFCSNKKDLLIKMNTMSSLTLIRSRSLALAMKNMNKQLLPLSHLPSALCSFKKWSFQKKPSIVLMSEMNSGNTNMYQLNKICCIFISVAF